MEPSNVDEEHAEGQIPIEEKMTMEDKLAESEIEREDRNEVAPSVTSNSAPSEAVCCNAPIETVSDLTDSNIPSEKLVLPLDILSLAVVEKPNQSKYPNDEIASMDLPARRQQVSDKTQPVVMNEEVPKVVLDHVPDRVIGCFTPLKLANIPDEEFDNVEAVGLADAVENPRNRPDVATVGALPVPEEQVVHSELISTSPNCYDLLPQQVVFAELQQENQSSSHVEVSASQLVHAVNNSLLANHGAPETENREQLHSASVDVTLSGNQFPTFEVEHQNHVRAGSSFPTAEAGEDEVLVHEPSSESRENSQLSGNHLDPCPVARVPELPIPSAEAGEDEVLVHEPSSESRESSQLRGNHLDPCPVAGVQELPNHAPRDLQGHSTYQVTTGNSTPELPDEPLQIELERMQKESEKLEKNQKDLISQLNSECEMEMQEMITKIRNNYDTKVKNTEAEYMLKKNELGKNQGVVLMNKMLADAFRSKCLDHRPYGLPGMQQGESESLMQHLQSAPTEHSATPATTPAPIAILNSMVPPVQRAPALFSNTPSRPPLIGAITPKGNPHTGSENRAMAPHLQAIKPPTASSGSLAIPPSTPQPPPPLSQQMQANLASHVRPDPQVVLPTSNVDLSANDMFPYLEFAI